VIDLARTGALRLPAARDQLPPPSGCLNSAPPGRWRASWAPALTPGRGSRCGHGCTRPLRPGSGPDPGLVSDPERWVPAGEARRVQRPSSGRSRVCTSFAVPAGGL